MRRSCYVIAGICIVVSVGGMWLALGTTGKEVALASAPVSNAPIGVAKGLHPGRVVWVHDPDATDWEGPGEGHWWEESHTSQAAVHQMMCRAIRALAGETGDTAAWEKLFRQFNETHGRGDVGYQPGEKIVHDAGGL
ncbi:MAG: hypothetical protein ABIP48_29365, partial [Planctomycetota bacterium]